MMNKEIFIKGLKLNKEQEAILKLENSNVLVNAGAGSGKTKVLTDRIIYRQLFHDIDIDKILVVTFTRAAARQMKDRIYKKLLDLKKNQEKLSIDNETTNLNSCIYNKVNEVIHKINSSDIMTIDAFCNKIVKMYYQNLDIEPNFRIMDSKEEKILSNKVIEDLFEKIYENLNSNSDNILNQVHILINNFCIDEDDSEIKKIVVRLKDKADTNINIKNWMENNIDIDSIKKNYYYHLDILKRSINLKKLKTLYEENDKTHLSTYTFIVNAIEYLFNKDSDYTDSYKFLVRFKQFLLENKVTLRKPTGKNISTELEEEFEVFREYINTIKKSDILNKDSSLEEILNNELDVLKKYVPALTYLVEEYKKSLIRIKKQKNAYTFADIQNFTIELLNDDIIVKQLREKYKEIYIDEYQDSNQPQEYILNKISNGNNMFMVGDMKQSIYRFRGADPTIFNRKYNLYTDDKSELSPGIRKNMSTNYRSTDIVLHDINCIFKSLMVEEIGGITFDKSHILKASDNNKVNIEDDELKGITKNEIISIYKEDNKEYENNIVEDKIAEDYFEINYVIKRITEMVGKEYIIDESNIDGKKKRKIEYKDITILFPTRSKLNFYLRALDEASIPYHTAKGVGFFNTKEIRLVLSILKVIDNPLIDLDLMAVLRSPIFGINDDDMIEIVNISNDELSLFEKIKLYINNYTDNELSKKLDNFIKEYTDIKVKTIYMDIYEIIEHIYERFIIKSLFSVMMNGNTRVNNLELLQRFASSFIEIGETSIYSFINYIEELKIRNEDVESYTVSNDENAITLQTIHASKGLEANIVFLIGCNFGTTDSNIGSIRIYDRYGYIFDEYDKKKKVKSSPKLIERYLKNRQNIEEIGEKIRLLYVALTRAKQKFIMVQKISQSEIDKSYDGNIIDIISDSLKGISVINLYKIIKYRDNDIIDENIYPSLNLNVIEKNKSFTNNDYKVIEKKVSSFIKNIKSKNSDDNTINQPKVISVSELKRVNVDIKPFIESRVENKHLTIQKGVENGIAYHNVMKYVDLLNPTDNIDLLIEMFFKNLIKPNRDVFLKFFNTDIGSRVKKAAIDNKVFREEKFRTYYNGYNIRGMVDLFFIEGDEIILIDYKTDHNVNEKILIDRYKYQIEIYRKSIEKILNKRVKEAYIYSFSLNKNIKILDNGI